MKRIINQIYCLPAEGNITKENNQTEKKFESDKSIMKLVAQLQDSKYIAQTTSSRIGCRNKKQHMKKIFVSFIALLAITTTVVVAEDKPSLVRNMCYSYFRSSFFMK